jgi:hypothetical protein
VQSAPSALWQAWRPTLLNATEWSWKGAGAADDAQSWRESYDAKGRMEH